MKALLTDRQLDNRIRKLKELERQINDLEAQAEDLRKEIKADLEAKGENEHQTGNWLIRWKDIISHRIDAKSLKAQLPDVYAAYARETRSKRFTITA